jgi:hypothetical protein
MGEAIQNLQGGLSQFVTGALPALFGGELEGNDTASGYAMAREQAMGQQGVPWGALQALMAKAYSQAVKCAAKSHASEDEVITVAVPGRLKGKTTVQQVAIADLAMGDFHCRPDTDSSFPETTAGKRAAITQLITEAATTPELALTLWEPKNQELIKEWMGMEDLEILGAESYEKQLEEIDELLKTQPVPPSPEEVQAFQQQVAQAQSAIQMGGDPGIPPEAPPGPKPSVPVDPEFDLHNYEFKACQDWLNSSDRREEEQKGNMAGVENVRLHALEHKKFMAMMPPPPMPMGGQPAPPAPGPAGGPSDAAIPPNQGLM